jgi:hypothetical protein
MIFPAKFNKPEDPTEQKVFNTLSKLPDADFTTFIGEKLTNSSPLNSNSNY